ncbi:MAG: TetR/AcrR family transcriptional regulator [Actinomycetota bacterium]|nr:TetR/AcrR family transcriptional regulator [Actinomycetota bacterium]
MAAPTRTPRCTWIEAGLGALAAGGPDAVRIEALAHALGVTRGGFYWHFADRRALLDEMLDTWERRSTQEVIDRVEREGGDPQAKAQRAGALTFSDQLLPIDLAVRDWSRREPSVANRLRRVDNRRMQYLRALLSTVCADEDELEARSLIAFSVAIGKHFIAADHGARTRADVLELVAKRLFAQ